MVYRSGRLRLVRSGIYIMLATALLLVGTLPATTITPHVQADGNCQITSISPHTVPANSDDGFTIDITDPDNAIAWARVFTPSSNLVIVNASSDWLPDVTVSSDRAVFSGNAVAPGSDIELDVEGDVSNFDPSNWSIVASTSQDGSSSYSCNGDSSITVQDTTPPEITSISADANVTSATISWQTDKTTTALIDYGTTAGYGSSVTDSNPTTGDQVTLTGLTPLTTYHYQITVTDTDGNTNQSVDATFMTAAQPTSTTNNPTEPAPPENKPIGTTVTNPADKTPPTIHFTSTLPNITSKEPTVTGVANDNIAVAKIEYSTDGGANWLTVDSTSDLDTKQATFSFTPLNLDDGTYVFMARAIDDGGNIGTTSGVTVVIDRLPPLIGGTLIALGPQVLTPDTNGIIRTIPGVDLMLTTSSIGGATSVNIETVNANSPNGGVAASFALHQVSDNGLWTGVLSFSKTGQYQLLAQAEDGAGNMTSRPIANVVVTTPGRTVGAKGPIDPTIITAYYLDTDSNTWVPWDGSPYGQYNPQLTDKHGMFNLFLPAGTYYLHAEAEGYQSVNSNSFTLTEPTAITSVLYMQPALTVGMWQLPSFSLATQQALPSTTTQALPKLFTEDSLVGTTLGNLTFTDSNGQTDQTIDWLGKPTVITVMADWAPSTAEQLPILAQLAQNSDILVKPIGLQADAGRLRAYDAIAGIDLPWLADPDGITITALRPSSVPTHYFLDRKGVIRQISYGVLSYDQLLNTLENLP